VSNLSFWLVQNLSVYLPPLAKRGIFESMTNRTNIILEVELRGILNRDYSIFTKRFIPCRRGDRISVPTFHYLSHEYIHPE
jgi:hypothetical protein